MKYASYIASICAANVYCNEIICTKATFPKANTSYVCVKSVILHARCMTSVAEDAI